MKRMIILIMVALLIPMAAYAEISQPSTWAKESVENLKASNMLKDEVFRNYKYNINRQEFIYLAVRLYETIKGSPIAIDKSISFKDTKDIYALKGATVGITSGIGNGNFGPKVLITREQLAVLLINTLKLAGAELKEAGQYRFNDENKFADWSKDAIYLAQANGIVNGVGNDQFNSKGNATTEVAMIIVNKILENGHYEGKSELQLRFENKELSFADALKQYPMSDRLMLEINRVSSWYDYDGDGLLDYEEVYRNYTNPNKVDTDGDGISDSDWDERKEYTYTFESELRLFPPYDLKFMESHLYQDIQIVEQTEDYADVKLLLYPYNSFYKTVVGNANWKHDNLELQGQLKPGLQNDWDAQMQKDLLALLLKNNIDPNELTDMQLLFKVVQLFDGYGNENSLNVWNRTQKILDGNDFHMYDWYLQHNEDGTYQLNETVLQGNDRLRNELEATINDTIVKFEKATGEKWSRDRVLSIMGSSKAAFYEKYHGSCSGTSEFYANIFQALGIPTKVLPLQTVLDVTQVDKKNIESHEFISGQINALSDTIIKSNLKYILKEDGGSGHVTNLIFIGNRWVNIDIAGGQKFNYSNFNEGQLVFFKIAEYDHSSNQKQITDFWLLPFPKGFSIITDNFDSIAEKYVNSVNCFSQKTYNFSDKYGIHINPETKAMINSFTTSDYQGSYGKNLPDFVLRAE